MIVHLNIAMVRDLSMENHDASLKSMISNAKSRFPKKTNVISIKTHGYEWLDGTAFWESPTLEVHSTTENKQAYEEFLAGKKDQRKGV